MEEEGSRLQRLYEMVGGRVGCSVTSHRQLKSRYRLEGESRPVEVLFELECDDQLAGDLEWNLADLFGYPRGAHYASFNWSTTMPRDHLAALCSKNVETGHLRRIASMG